MEQKSKQIQQKENKKITKDMIIQDILAEHPDKAMLISEILIDFGIHCVGCGANGFETLEEGVLGHGFTEQELDMLIENLNKAINQKNTNNPNEKKQLISVNDFSLKLTEKAVKKLKEIMKEENKADSYLRAAVLAGGCSGFTYDLELSEEKYSGDFEIEQDGIKILVSQESAEYLNNTKIDFLSTLKESGFKFNNPNATKSCDCGKSFS